MISMLEHPIENFLLALDNNSNKLEEYFETASKEEITKVWNKVKSEIQDIVKNFHNKENFNSANYEDSLKSIDAVIHAINTFINKNKIRTTALIQTVEILGGLLDVLSIGQNGSEELVKSAISQMCETWYVRKEPSGNVFLPQIITYLLVESLKPSSKEVLVKRLFNIRLGFEELDLSTAGADFNKDLLLRCFIHPTFLRSNDGAKLLSFLLTVSNGFLLESALGVIKSQISSGGKAVSKIYGEILQKAWKESTINEDCMNELENHLQDLVHDAVHSADPKYFRGLRILVKSFHDIKRTDIFEEMLVRVFEPILWRSLRCANATVRSQAAVLFLDVFPLQRVHGKPEECDQLLQKQFDQLISLLKDGDHRVRATAVSGIFHILREYWDILPSGTVQNILKFIFETLAFDVSSANVRFCVISGIRELLQQPLSHQSLRLLLPLIANSIHDKAEKNRLAFVRLLNDVKALRDLHFYDVVSVPHLLGRFAEDRNNNEIASAMCELLLESFYPQNDSTQSKAAAGKELVGRCMQFIEESPLAAEAFYGNLHTQIGIGSIVKLCVMLFHVLHSSTVSPDPISTVKIGKGKRSRDNRRNQEEERDDSYGNMTDDVKIGVVRIIYLLLDRVKIALVDENFCLELLFKYFTPTKFKGVFDIMAEQYSGRAEVGISLLRLTQVLLHVSACSEGSQFLLLHKSCGMDYWIDQLGQVFLSKSNNMMVEQEYCKCIIDIIITLQQSSDLLKRLSGTFGQDHTKRSKSKGILLLESKLLSSLVQFMCQPQFSAGMEHMEKELNLALGAASAFIEEAITLNEDYLEVVAVLLKSISSWAVYQDCSDIIANNIAEVETFDSRPLGLITSWSVELIGTALSDFTILNCVIATVVLSLTDSFYLIEELQHRALGEQIMKLLAALAKCLGHSEARRLNWISSSTCPQLMNVLNRLHALKVMPNDFAEELQKILDDLKRNTQQKQLTEVIGEVENGKVRPHNENKKRQAKAGKPSLLML